MVQHPLEPEVLRSVPPFAHLLSSGFLQSFFLGRTLLHCQYSTAQLYSNIFTGLLAQLGVCYGREFAMGDRPAALAHSECASGCF